MHGMDSRVAKSQFMVVTDDLVQTLLLLLVFGNLSQFGSRK